MQVVQAFAEVGDGEVGVGEDGRTHDGEIEAEALEERAEDCDVAVARAIFADGIGIGGGETGDIFGADGGHGVEGVFANGVYDFYMRRQYLY